LGIAAILRNAGVDGEWRGHTLSSASGTLIVGSPPEVPKVTLNLDVGLCNIEHRAIAVRVIVGLIAN